MAVTAGSGVPPGAPGPDDGPAGARATGLRASVAGSMVGKAAELVTLALLAVAVPRVLGPADYGRFSVPLNVVTLASLAMTLGGPTVMVRFVPAASPDERIPLARALGGRLARGRAVQLVVVALAATLAASVAPSAFPPAVVALVVAAMVLSVGASLALQVPLGLGRTGPWAARYPLQNGVLIAAVLLLHPHGRELGPVIGIVVSSVAAAVLGLVAVLPVVRAGGPRVPVPAGAVRFGLLQAAGAALVQVVHRGGVVLAAVLQDRSTEVGHAALATGLALGISYAVLQAFTVALPHLPVAAGASTAAAEAVLRRLAAGLVAALLPAMALAALLLPDLVPAVFGSDYEDAVDALVPALGVIALAPLAALVVQVASLRLRPEVALANGAVAAAAFLATGLLAVPAWGAAGATAAALAGVAAGLALSVRLLRDAAGPALVMASLAGAAAVVLLGALVAP